MILTFNLRDATADDWTRFWFGVKGEMPVSRFGFRMCVIDGDAQMGSKVEKRCKDQMKWVKAILRAEEDDLRRKSYQMVRDCKSHRAMVGARKSGDVVRRNYEEIAKGVVLDW